MSAAREAEVKRLVAREVDLISEEVYRRSWQSERRDTVELMQAEVIKLIRQDDVTEEDHRVIRALIELMRLLEKSVHVGMYNRRLDQAAMLAVEEAK